MPSFGEWEENWDTFSAIGNKRTSCQAGKGCVLVLLFYEYMGKKRAGEQKSTFSELYIV